MDANDQKPTEPPTEPTEEGKRRYPPDGIYEDDYPCTCREDCPSACKGQCGCEACHAGYSDFLSMDID